MQDLEGGATSVALRFDTAARNGLDPDSPGAADLVADDGVTAYNAADLDAIFDTVQMPLVGIAIEAAQPFCRRRQRWSRFGESAV